MNILWFTCYRSPCPQRFLIWFRDFIYVFPYFDRMMWAAGILASISSISYPAISAFVSMHADADKQGLVQVSNAALC